MNTPPASKNNARRFAGRTAREALQLVKQAFGDDAVVLSTRPSPDGSGGVEVLAMAGDDLQRLDAPVAADEVQRDADTLAMSTLSFQDYVRERMLKRRAAAAAAVAPAAATPPVLRDEPVEPVLAEPVIAAVTAPVRAAPVVAHALPDPRLDTLRDDLRADLREQLAAMHDLIDERFGALAFMEKLQLHPRRAALTQRLLDAGFSPALIRKLVQGLLDDCGDENAWAASVLERNCMAAESEPALESMGGVYALVGATGVGKTTTTAKIAAAFATQHGSAALGLVTLDAYRVGAQEQLRAYGRILGVPVHTAHDRASLEDLLELLAGKKMVLIDTAGIGQRDPRTRELLDMLSHRSIHKLLVINAASQGETIDDVAIAWRAAQCRGVVLSKLDEAVKLGPALDAAIRHKLRIVGVANGQRVPEDWHRLSAQALVQRALRPQVGASWKLDAQEVQLVFAGAQRAAAAAPAGSLLA
jgi:flagellar biosynthesis protein FlhF